MPPVTHLLYLHGFRSSPASTKARLTLAWLAQHAPQVHAWCPQLPPSPREAIDMLREGIARFAPPGQVDQASQLGIVGSSLGGFYATVLAEELGCRAVLVNPAVDPARHLANEIGEQPQWHNPEQRIDFRPAYVEELRALTPKRLTHMACYFAVIATGDEVLDWREMAGRYAGAPQRIVQGSDHALTDYPAHLGWVMEALGLTT